MQKSNFIKKCVFLFCTVIIIMLVFTIVLQYDVEGEKNLPYKISKILVVSTIDGNAIDDGENIWNINIKQANDLYFYIDKNENTDKTIKKITLQNFTLNEAPKKGEIAIYRPTGELSNLYSYSQQNYFNDSIVYTGGIIDDLKILEIGNSGGVLGCRISLDNLGRYISNESTEMTYDASLLEKVDVNLEDITFSINVDMIIETSDNISYKGTISFELPSEDIIQNGSGNFEITDFSNVIFKRFNEKS